MLEVDPVSNALLIHDSDEGVSRIMVSLYLQQGARVPRLIPTFLLPGGLRTPDLPLTHTGGRGTHFLVHLLFFLVLFGGKL